MKGVAAMRAAGGLAVLGGAGGIGRALVAAASARGWRVAVLDLPTSLEAHPPSVPAFAVDATDAAALARGAVWARETLGGLRGFANLCGFTGPQGPVAEADPALWREVIDGNLTAAFLSARAFAPVLDDGGAMVMTGSGLGHLARPGFGPYAAAKAGIAQLTKQLALELAPRLRVNNVAPSAVDTEFLRGGAGRAGAPVTLDLAAYAAAVPLRRIAVPADVVGPMLFLLSDEAAYVTGQTLHVNGGTHMP